ncbi:MAG: hypothetical protein IAG13_25485 [Deltaproteobacteria bacterium]|nr:hypothetical protein [Nannocystaceae bacterium]
MRTYTAKRTGDGEVAAFEIENVYVSPALVACVLSATPGVERVRSARSDLADDVRVAFTLHGRECVVVEPYGDNSRYWIGPRDGAAPAPDVSVVERALADYQPPLWRRVLGNLISLRVPWSEGPTS